MEFAALDIVDTEITLALGKRGERGLLFSGICEGKSAGIEKGNIAEPEAVKQALSVFFKSCRKRGSLPPLFLCFPSQKVVWEKKQASLTLSSKPITWREIEMLQASVKDDAQKKGRQLLHCVPVHYCIDGNTFVDDPIGMKGNALSLTAHIASAELETIERYLDCVHEAGAETEAVIAQPLAEGECLSEKEREEGAAILNIGFAATTLSLFQQGCFCKTLSIPVGGYHIQRDLVYGLKITKEEADRVKRNFARLGDLTSPLSHLVTTQNSERAKFVREIIVARVEEIISLAAAEARKGEVFPLLKHGIVLAGQEASLRGIDKIAQHIFQLPVRVAKGRSFLQGSETIHSPAHIVAAGALSYAYQNYDYALPFWRKYARMGKWMIEWLTNFFFEGGKNESGV